MTTQEKNNYLKNFHKFQQNREKYFAPKIFAVLRQQYSQFWVAYKAGNDISTSLMLVSSHGMDLVLTALYIDAGRVYGAKVYAGLPKASKKTKARAAIGFNEEIIALINTYFEGDILNTSEGITDTTRNLIRVVMQIAAEEGRDLDWIEEQLFKESYDLTRNRSRLIARTETVTASNQAAFFAAAKTGLLMKKEWLSASDNRVRIDHAMVNGSIVDMEDYFTVGDSRMLLPGAKTQENGLETPAKEVCNCRCVVLYEAVSINGKLIEFDYGIWHAVAA